MPKRKAPCPACLACGVETHKHTICTSGPPPEHGPACSCEFCGWPAAERVVEQARFVLANNLGFAGREDLDRLVTAYDARPEHNRRHWAEQRAKIAAAQRTERAS